MDETEVRTLIFYMWNDKWVRTSVFLIFILFLFMTVALSLLSGIIFLGAYIGGFVVFNSVFSCQSVARNPLSFFVEKNRRTSYAGALRLCVVCGDGKCNRHKPSAPLRQPWMGLNLPEELDEAIEDFLNRTLKEFVYAWYGGLSADESFVLELRQSVRYAASVLLQKGLQVDLAAIILKKLVPAGMSHLDDYLSCLRLSARQAMSLESAAVQYLGPRLHPAAKTRDNELAYLRNLTELLMPSLLAPSQLNCKNLHVLIRELLAGWVLLPLLDVLADPAIINSLLILLLEKHQLTDYPDKPGKSVEFLARFVAAPPPSRGSALCVDMASVLKDQKLLYPFMQFLKAEGCVNILQFCLDVEEFNRKMLTPDLTSVDLDNLHKEAWDLFSVYFSPDSPDCLQFNPLVVKEMHAVVLGPSADVVKLRTTAPLFQAYESAYGQLEATYCPLFHQSDEFYTLLCGSRLSTGYNKSGSNSPMQQGSPAKSRAGKKWSEGGAVARISSRLHKIKGVLRAQPIEGNAFETDTALDLAETEYAEELQQLEQSSYRDLSAWRVSIPSVENKPDVANKMVPVFNIDVQRIDISLDDDPALCHWTVERRYNDFYLLDSKLTEFHGDLVEAQLPPKRLLFGPRGLEFMQSKREVFELYLQSLLQKPALRGSDLLHSFLRSPGEFVPGAGGEGFGRLIRRTVPLKLRKERGQHLEPFLNTFLASLETNKSKSSKFEYQDVNMERPSKVRCLTKSIFGDNFGVKPQDPVSLRSPRNIAVQGLFDCILYVVVRVFEASQPVVRLLLAVRTVCHDMVNSLAQFYLDRKLKKLLAAPRLAHLVNLLQGAIFNPKTKPPTKEDLSLRAARALERLESLFPGFLARWYGPGYKQGVGIIFRALQSPSMNKQLAYTLLDIVAAELYPDLDNGIIASPQLTDK